MENSKEKNKSNIAIVILLCIVILLLLVVITILLFHQNTNRSTISNGTDSDIEEHASNVSPNENNVPNVSDNNSVSDDENIIRATKTIKLNDDNCKVDVSCKWDLERVFEDISVYTTSYTVTINGKKCKGILGSEISILPDNPKPEDFFAITKIADKNTNKEYLVVQVISNLISSTSMDFYIIDDDLSILGTIHHSDRTAFIINNEPKELTVKSDYISDYTWNFDRDSMPDISVVQHIYTVQNGKFVDTIKETFREGEYEASGVT